MIALIFFGFLLWLSINGRLPYYLSLASGNAEAGQGADVADKKETPSTPTGDGGENMGGQGSTVDTTGVWAP